MLKALTEYYDCLRDRGDEELTPPGYSKVIVNYNLVLNPDGSVNAILPYVQEVAFGKKTRIVGRNELFPFRNSISGIAAETVDHREKYIFGLVYDGATQSLLADKNSLLAFDKCKEKNMEFLGDVHTDVAEAYKAFMQTWDPKAQLENEMLLRLGKEYSGAKFVITLFGYETEPLNRQREVMEKWDKSVSDVNTDDGIIGQCAVCGEVLPVARTHDSISGLGGLSTGVNLVCFNNTAFESYGKKQSYNSCISQKAMKKYTAALNYLAASDAHKQRIDDMILLFWANTRDDEQPYLDSFIYGVSPPSGEAENAMLKAVFENMAQGKESDMEGVDFNTDFYVLGVKANSSRLAVKIFEKNSFGNFVKNISRHIVDMRFEQSDKQMPVWQIASELKSPHSDDENPEIAAKLLVSVLKGTPYPSFMLDAAVKRCRTDHDIPAKKFYSVSRRRARIIRACLLRSSIINQGEYSMLNENSTDTAYNLGRLFAVLEKTQTDALGDINSTIKDKFFSSACATPYLVFPRLLKLTQSHLAKLDDGNRIYKDRLIQTILSAVDGEFPKALNTVKQGMFILGYYQQKEKLYEKSNRGEE